MNVQLAGEPIEGRNSSGSLAISARNLGKAYASFASPVERLGSVLFGRGLPQESFWALRDLSLDVPKGESLGVIGQNGAGKSTLLQLLCSTLAPTTGTLQVQGRIAALLELGAGFNPDFSGRDNLLLNGPLLGLTRAQLEERIEGIIDFSGVRGFIDQPVKTYSSGMFVRLAFSLATSVDPDILVIDEALSVGDGEFARKSFDRILAMKERGTTILFCSHSLYQVEAFCSRVIWLHQGQVRAIGEPHDVVRDYTLFLAAQADDAGGKPATTGSAKAITQTPGHARITRVDTILDGVSSTHLSCAAGEGCLEVVIDFESDPDLPAPTAGMTFEVGSVMVLSTVVSLSDGVALQRDSSGRGRATIRFDKLPLRKGEYLISAYLGNENAIHLYSQAIRIASLRVHDARPEPGVVDLPHTWSVEAGAPQGSS
jgi:lipopolysaccharide transport system ATP-binding protein